MTVKLTLDYGFGKRQTSEENTRTRIHARLTGRATRGEHKVWSDSRPQNVIIAIFFMEQPCTAINCLFFFFSIGQASEVGDPTSNSTALVLITVLDTNDNPPEFFHSSYHFSIREDLAKPGYIVTDQLNVQDKDINVRTRHEKKCFPERKK